MPILITARGAMVAALLSLPAACSQPQPDKFATSEAQSPSVAAVRAFAEICGRPEEAEVLRRAARYGFAPLPPDRAAAMTSPEMRDRRVRILVRPATGAPAILFWTAQRPMCELVLGGVEPRAVEAEFDALIATLAAQPNLAVINVPPGMDSTGPMRLRRAAVAAPRALIPAPPRAFSLRVNDNQDHALRVSLIAQVMVPQAAATPPPSPQWLPKQ